MSARDDLSPDEVSHTADTPAAQQPAAGTTPATCDSAFVGAAASELQPAAPVVGDQPVRPIHQQQSPLTFLLEIQPLGPWSVCSLNHATGIFLCPERQYHPGDEVAAQKWIDEQQALERSIYYRAAAIKANVWPRNAKDADVIGTRWAWVDIDPDKRIDRDTARTNIHRLLSTDLPSNVWPAAIVIDSGNGYQALWPFKEPWSITNDKELDDFRQINRWLKIQFGADSKFAPSSLLRMPWTINFKRKIGNSYPVASVVKNNQANRYERSDFGRTVDDGQRTGKLNNQDGDSPAQTAVITQIDSLDDLTKVVIPVKNLIHFGWDEKNPEPSFCKWHSKRSAGWKPSDWSRSHAVFFLIQNLKSKRVADGVILHLLTDSKYGISAHCRDNGGEKCARTQLKHWYEKNVATASDQPSMRDIARELLKVQDEPIIHWNDEYFVFQDGIYVPKEIATVRQTAYDFLEQSNISPSQRLVSDFLDAINSLVHIDRSDRQPPCWLNDDPTNPDPMELLVCRNGLLHIPTRKLLPQTPNFLTFNALDYDYDPNAPQPTGWLEFLNQVWPEDNEKDCIRELQKLFGYFISLDTSQQKLSVIIGPKRSGKGTIIRVVTSLVGISNVATPKLNCFHSDFGMQTLIGKQLAIFTDMRLPQSDQSTVVESLLAISGEDSITINRKFLSAWQGTLPTRILIASNNPLTFDDASGALSARYLILQMRQSFAGREDFGLTDKLLDELPGILNWAIEGWDILYDKREKLIQPESSSDVVDLINDHRSDAARFVDEQCDVGFDCTCEKMVIFNAFKEWQIAQAILPWTLGRFIRELFTCTAGKVADRRLPADESRSESKDNPRIRKFCGIRLKEYMATVASEQHIPF